MEKKETDEDESYGEASEERCDELEGEEESSQEGQKGTGWGRGVMKLRRIRTIREEDSNEERGDDDAEAASTIHAEDESGE